MEVASASTDWPASIVPIGSMVPEMATGMRRPTRAKARSQPRSAALTLRVSCAVSIRR